MLFAYFTFLYRAGNVPCTHTHTHTHITRLDLFCLVPEIPINFTPMLREITNAQYSINSCNKNVTFGAISLLDHSFL